MNILIQTPNYLGDTINATPAIELIKAAYPEASIALMGGRFLEELFKNDKRISHYITYDLNLRHRLKVTIELIKKINRSDFQLGFLFTNSFHSAFLFFAGGVREIVGYKNDAREFMLDYKIKRNRNKHYINHYASLVNTFLGNKYTYLPKLTIAPEFSHPYKFDNKNKVITLYLGGEAKGYRRYPDSNSVLLCQRLLDKGYNLVFVGDKNDNIKHQEYTNSITPKERVVNLSGKTSTSEFVSAIKDADLLITIDSSALHIGAATERPTLALIGLSNSPVSAILPKSNLCHTLIIEDNLIREEDYIKNITPDMVVQKVEEIMTGNKKKTD